MLHELADTTDTAARQLKLNEYSYQNKMDTLFFFQIMLLSLLILCVFAYGVRMDFFSNAMFFYIALLLFIIDTIIFLSRYSYTVNLRDQTTWDRRRFDYQAASTLPPVTYPTDFSAYGLYDISGVNLQGLCKTAGYSTT